jgi:NadR type nicotinamide-nucleotide adenylyltransferase
MSKHRFRLGLVVGKFAPLHRGHERLVEQASAQCDRVLVLSYTSQNFEHCDVSTRRRWLGQCFPGHETLAFDNAWLSQECMRQGVACATLPPDSADDAIHQAFLAWLLRDVLHRQPDALFSNEAYGEPCARHLSLALGQTVTSVQPDRARSQLPISASQIRSDPAASLDWLSPVVRSSFVRRVGILGGESSGKTTLAEALAARLNSCWVAEYGRERWEEKNGLLTESDLLEIAKEQIRREEQATQSAGSVLVCDTTPLTTLGYSLWMFKRVDPELGRLAQRRYDALVLCTPDFAFVQDGTRQHESFRQLQHAWYVEQLSGQPCPVLRASKGVPQRVEQVLDWLQKTL